MFTDYIFRDFTNELLSKPPDSKLTWVQNIQNTGVVHVLENILKLIESLTNYSAFTTSN